jgi:actin-related protein 6
MILTKNSPIKYTWLGAARMTTNRDLLKSVMVTRAEYDEHGAHWVSRKFSDPSRPR